MDEDHDQALSNVPFRIGRAGSGNYDDDGENESSEDELDIILHGTPEQKRRLTRSLSRGSLQMSSSDDDFEKEMEMELDANMILHEKQFRTDVEKKLTAATRAQQTQSSAASGGLPGSSSEQQCYDEVYFDSDDDEDKKETPVEGARAGDGGDQDKEQAKKQHRIPTNKDLLYDPNIDEDNQNWMNKQRAKYYPNRAPKRSHDQTSSESPSGAGNPAQPSQTPKPDKVTGATCPPSIPKTDAILNCPACMTTLCIDCQRHELYTNQYRAMFVMNCCIIRSEQLRYPESKNKKKKWRKKKRRHEETMEGGEADEEEGSGAAGDELFNPVKCSICNTEVGVLDKQEIFHFFNVLSSAA
ncbi:E2F-associated phosphoprotein [Strongylocentrotus purpuratus]|uniref:E2F-associated phosphoprotein n=1 Tax=Strongylocentrotus purpuratus TaxID=7668 RepID=A0A7M7G1B9_STRPU|nr:E2F-associated phosphoprotein [Strongylocentrotus purpuratus]|eukprot:XP_001197735.1 PREDICTED: E2F-associated phosphoprotein [Strongylocentrotus purpuratus]